MPLPYGPVNHKTTLDEAKRYTQRYREAAAIKAGAFDRGIIDEILAQPDCQGIRCYLGLTDTGAPTVIIVGVNSAGNDIIDSATPGNNLIAETWIPCPPICGAANPLNS